MKNFDFEGYDEPFLFTFDLPIERAQRAAERRNERIRHRWGLFEEEAARDATWDAHRFLCGLDAQAEHLNESERRDERKAKAYRLQLQALLSPEDFAAMFAHRKIFGTSPLRGFIFYARRLRELGVEPIDPPDEEEE